MAQEVTDATFDQEVLNSDVPVLVDFWAPWCGPCKQLGPIVEEVASENEGKGVKVVKVNVDENQQSPAKYGVLSIPTLVYFKNGEVVDQTVGVQDKSAIQAKLDGLKG